MKILTVCEHGNVRSVALAYLLKTIYGYDALACGVRETSKETKKMLFDWADKIIFLDTSLYEGGLPTNKVRFLIVGIDIWHNPFSHGLQHKLLKGLKSLDL